MKTTTVNISAASRFLPVRSLGVAWLVLVLIAPVPLFAAVDETRREMDLLRQQNERLQRQMEKQQEMIENLGRQVSNLARDQAKSSGDATAMEDGPSAKSATAHAFGKVHISGEGGLGFIDSQANGPFPNQEFRVDEAKLFVEAPVWKDVYLFTEVNFLTREQSNTDLRVGELYLDFENVSRLWNQDGQLTLRAGRFDIPFGEEYQVRDAIDNPLISHSLSDLWGVDEGVELYGTVGRLQYALAVQNGGVSVLRDFDEDKAVAARVGIDPAKWLHLSVSAMRTGALNAQQDKFSELWLGPGFIRSLGSTNTKTFQANLVEGDVQVRWASGHLKAAGGTIRYDDDDPAANNQRNVYYYSVEGVQNIAPKLYAAARWSHMLAPDGFPIAGNGNAGQFFFNTRNPLTTDLWLLSLGLGYRLGGHLVLKAEYSFERGELINGQSRIHENSVGAMVAYRF